MIRRVYLYSILGPKKGDIVRCREKEIGYIDNSSFSTFTHKHILWCFQIVKQRKLEAYIQGKNCLRIEKRVRFLLCSCNDVGIRFSLYFSRKEVIKKCNKINFQSFMRKKFGNAVNNKIFPFRLRSSYITHFVMSVNK